MRTKPIGLLLIIVGIIILSYIGYNEIIFKSVYAHHGNWLLFIGFMLLASGIVLFVRKNVIINFYNKLMKGVNDVTFTFSYITLIVIY